MAVVLSEQKHIGGLRCTRRRRGSLLPDLDEGDGCGGIVDELDSKRERADMMKEAAGTQNTAIT